MSNDYHARTLLGSAIAILGSVAVAQAAEFDVVHSFSGRDGAFPISTPIFDSGGNLYGTTFLGGSCEGFDDGCGTIFSIAPHGDEHVLYAFKGGTDGDG